MRPVQPSHEWCRKAVPGRLRVVDRGGQLLLVPNQHHVSSRDRGAERHHGGRLRGLPSFVDEREVHGHQVHVASLHVGSAHEAESPRPDELLDALVVRPPLPGRHSHVATGNLRN